MSRAAFFDWAQAQDERYEFDGWAPVAMTGGNLAHSRICQNIWFALRTRLRGQPCQVFGPDAGLATIGDAVRYPDALVTCSPISGAERVVPGAVVVFEVLSPTSGHTDRIDKLIEYRAVASLRRYVIVESASLGLTVFSREAAQQAWTADPRTGHDVLALPEIAVEIPIAEFYEGAELAAGG